MGFRIVFVTAAAIACLAQAAPAQEVFRVVVKAYEADLRSMRLPGNANGTLSFRPCSHCEFKTVRVTPSTRYEADGETYDLAGFRRAVQALGRGKTAVTVKHHLESDLITTIRVTSY